MNKMNGVLYYRGGDRGPLRPEGESRESWKFNGFCIFVRLKFQDSIRYWNELQRVIVISI